MLGAYLAMQVYVRVMTLFGFVIRYDDTHEHHDDPGDDAWATEEGEPYSEYAHYGDDHRAA
jgi:hypothetical protein